MSKETGRAPDGSAHQRSAPGNPVPGVSAAQARKVGPVTWVLLTIVRAYQLVVSPWLPRSCRYYPTCSAFAVGALRTHGPLKGTALAGWRVLRCNPWSAGGVDHVPERGSWVGRRRPMSSSDGAGEQTHPGNEGAVEHRDRTEAPGPSTLSRTDRGAGRSPLKDHREKPG